MPLEYVLTGWSMNSPMSANAPIASKRASISRCDRPRMSPLRKTFSRPVNSGLKPAPSSSSAATRPRVVDAPGGRLQRAADDLQQRRLARAVAPDDADRLAARDVEADVAQRPELAVVLAARAGEHLLQPVARRRVKRR